MRTAAMLLLVPVTLCGCFESYALLADSDRDARDVLEAGDAETVNHAPGADADADVDAFAEVEDSCCAPDDPISVSCQDGFWCNGPEQVNCSCECMPPGDLIDCDDGDSATVNWCDETMDVCRHSVDVGDAGADAEADAEADGDADACAGGWFDSTSGLCWQNPPDPTTRIWDDAVAYCDALSLGGRDDWYLPTIDELRSLIRNCPATETGGSCNVTADCLGPGCRNVECSGCAYGEGPGGAYWPAELHGIAYWYWSSSRFTGDVPNAWHVDFDGAYVHREHISRLFLVRCVRPGP